CEEYDFGVLILGYVEPDFCKQMLLSNFILYLIKANLQDVDLQDADLNKTILFKASVSKAALIEAQLCLTSLPDYTMHSRDCDRT
ncbi:MAG: pentapeptide repeat-containing protein, partial [bacterium]